MSVDELERLTGAGLDREIRNLRDLGLWEDAAELEAVRERFVPVAARQHTAQQQMTAHRSWWAMFRAWAKGSGRR